MPCETVLLVCKQPKENGAGKKADARGGVAIRMPYLRVVDMQDDSDGDTYTSTSTFT